MKFNKDKINQMDRYRMSNSWFSKIYMNMTVELHDTSYIFSFGVSSLIQRAEK